MSGLELRGIVVRYRQAGARPFAAVDRVSFAVDENEMLGLVGESGCGKTTLGRAILGLVPLAAGEVHWAGGRIDDLHRRAFRLMRRELQCVFQDPHACLDPRMTVADSVAEPLRALERGMTSGARARRVLERLAEVGVGSELAARYPHQLSGGQLQRVVIARALVVDPRFVVCDEPVSSLDVTVQDQIIRLLERLRSERRLTSLFISHNLAVVARLCERVMVMYCGRIVESAARAEIVSAPLHPYTRELLDAVPGVDARARARLLARAARPRPAADAPPPEGACAFAARCPHAQPRCRAEAPQLRELPAGRLVSCHRADEWPQGLLPAIPA